MSEENTNEEGGVATAPAPQPVVTPTPTGQFAQALTAPNSKIKRTRAMQLTQTTQMLYKRRVEDVANDVRNAVMDAQGQLDLHGDHALSLHPAAKDFDASVWVQANIEARMSIRNLIQKLAVTYDGYSELFGEDPTLITGIDLSGVTARVSIPLLD